jgi:HlyD family secretion protein
MTTMNVVPVPPDGSSAGASKLPVEERTSSEKRKRLRAMARSARQAIAALAVVVATVACIVALRPRPVPADVAEATRGPLAVIVEESGTTRVTDRYAVSAPVVGSLGRVSLEPGDRVERGDVLARILPGLSPLLDERSAAQADARLAASLSALAQARVQAARAKVAVERAEQDRSRTRQLAATGSLGAEAVEVADFEARMRGQELKSAGFGVDVAEEEVRAARAALDLRSGPAPNADRGRRSSYVDVVAPVSGVVLRVQQKSAAVVAAGAPILEVGDLTSLEVVVDLLTTDAVHVRPGTAVTLQGWGGEGGLAGQVRRVEPAAFTRASALGIDEQRVNVVVAIVEPVERWSMLADGYRVEARFVLWKSPDVIRVPHGAVFRRGEGWAAYRVENSIARLREVKLDHRGELEVEVTSGLAPGDQVIVHPGDRVRDGVRVEVR